jgi:hypothetical protein
MGERSCFVCGTTLVCQRSTRRFCANACRQSAYRRRAAPRVRQRRGVSRLRVPHGERRTVSLADAVVRPISLRQARRIVEQYEPMCAIAIHAYGLFIAGALASVVVFGAHPAGNLSPRHAGRIALLRGATLPWAPRNCGSKLIRRAMALLPARYTAVTAFSDPTLGENGTIYRAAGFRCIGPSSGGRRVLVHYQGRVLSERAARSRFGTSATRLAALGLKVETVPRRERWVAVPGAKRADRKTGPPERAPRVDERKVPDGPILSLRLDAREAGREGRHVTAMGQLSVVLWPVSELYHSRGNAARSHRMATGQESRPQSTSSVALVKAAT